MDFAYNLFKLKEKQIKKGNAMSYIKSSLLAASAFVLIAPTAFGAGFQLKEQSASLQGLSFAGASAKADDASVMYFNPAGITRLKGKHAYGTVSLIKPSTKFDQDESQFSAQTAPAGATHTVNDGEGGDAGSLAAVPAAYVKAELDNDVHIGFAVNTPFGLTTEYDDGWVGRYHALKSELLTINMAPTVAWKVNENWSFGASANIQYAEAELTNATASGGGTDLFTKLKGDDIGFGFRLGALYEPTDKTRIGVAYHSGIHHELTGEVKSYSGSTVVSNIAAKAKLRTPDIASLGVYHELNDRWAVMSELAWTNWSTFEYLTVQNRDTSANLSSIEEKWNDSYFMALGAEFHPCDYPNRAWQFGIAYDKTPVEDEYRTFRIPDEDRLWLSVGYGHEWENKSFHIGYSHIIANEADVVEDESSTAKGVVAGSFDANVNILSANFTMKF